MLYNVIQCICSTINCYSTIVEHNIVFNMLYISTIVENSIVYNMCYISTIAEHSNIVINPGAGHYV